MPSPFYTTFTHAPISSSFYRCGRFAGNAQQKCDLSNSSAWNLKRKNLVSCYGPQLESQRGFFISERDAKCSLILNNQSNRSHGLLQRRRRKVIQTESLCMKRPGDNMTARQQPARFSSDPLASETAGGVGGAEQSGEANQDIRLYMRNDAP